MSDRPVEGEPMVTVDTTTGRWDGGRHYVVVCQPCEYRSRQLSRSQAYLLAREHAETREHWMWRTRITPRKRLTGLHWQEIRDENPYDPRTRLNYGGPDYDKLDREAEAAGYGGDGHGRPWYRRHIMRLLAVTADPEAYATHARLEEIARAERERPALQEALREWLDTVELIARVRGDA